MSDKKLLVAAIDIGTTYSGYAYSWNTEFEANPDRIHTNQLWTTAIGHHASLKTPTVILFNEKKEFNSFGFDAEENYIRLSQTGEHHSWFYFTRFKMKLYQDCTDRSRRMMSSMKIKDECGKRMAARVVFSAAIRFLKEMLGGTVDIVAHEVQVGEFLREIYSPTGGPWGGTRVDEAFKRVLEEIFGSKMLDHFSAKFTEENIEIWRNFEAAKRRFSQGGDLNLRLPAAFTDANLLANNETVQSTVEASEYTTQIKVIRDKLQLGTSFMESLFEPVITDLCQHLRELFMKQELCDVSTIVLVGGVSNARIIKNAIKDAFPGKEVVVPDGSTEAIMSGAVMFGHKPTTISVRKMRHTYGVSNAVPFIEGQHRPEMKFTTPDGREVCEDRFKIFVRKEEKVIPGETRFKHRFRACSSTKKRNVEVYKTFKENPEYISDEGVEKIADVSINTETKTELLVDVIMKFGNTEIEVEVQEVGNEENKASKMLDASLDFMVAL